MIYLTFESSTLAVCWFQVVSYTEIFCLFLLRRFEANFSLRHVYGLASTLPAKHRIHGVPLYGPGTSLPVCFYDTKFCFLFFFSLLLFFIKSSAENQMNILHIIKRYIFFYWPRGSIVSFNSKIISLSERDRFNYIFYQQTFPRTLDSPWHNLFHVFLTNLIDTLKK